MRRRLVWIVLTATAFGLVLAGPAAAWKVVMADYVQGTSAGRAVAKKCKGGKVGYYDLTQRAASAGGDFEYALEAQMPVFPKWTQFKDVQIAMYGEGFTKLPPEIQTEMINAYGTFWDTMFTRYRAKKDELEFRHQGLIIFGSYLFPPGESEVKFKPKQGC